MQQKLEPNVSSVLQLIINSNSSTPVSSSRVLCFFVADSGPMVPTPIDNDAEFLRMYTDGFIKRSAHTSFFHALKVVKSLPIMACRLATSELSQGVAVPSNTKVLLKKSEVLTDELVITISTVNAGRYKIADPTTWAIKVGDRYFCTSDYLNTENDVTYLEGTRVNLDVVLNPADSLKTNMTLFCNAIASYINKLTEANAIFAGILDSDDESILLSATLLIKSSEVVSSKSGEMVQSLELNSLYDNNQGDKFVIASKYPITSDLFDFSVSNVVSKPRGGIGYFEFDLSITNIGLAETTEYRLSTDPDAKDGYQMDMYIHSINEFRNDILLIDLFDDEGIGSLTNCTNTFGTVDLVQPKYDQAILPNVYTAAIDKAELIEDTRISLISDCGIIIPAFQSRLNILAQYFKAEVAWSMPDYAHDLLIAYRNAVGVNTTYGLFHAPWNEERALVDFSVKLSASVYYLEALGANASGNYEYAPIYGKETGLVTAKRLSKDFTSAQRELLLAAQINPIIFKKANNISYIVNNLTATAVASDLQEDQVMRFVNTVRYDCDGITEKFLSYDWDDDTCYKIKVALENYFTVEVSKLGRIPMTGTPVIIAKLNGRNKISVKIDIIPKGSVKYITIYYNVISLA